MRDNEVASGAAVVCAGLAALLGCRVVSSPAAMPTSRGQEAPVADDDRLAELAAAYWNVVLESNPLFATEIGDRRFDGRVPDLSQSAHEREGASYRVLKDEVDRIPSTVLSGRDRTTRTLLLGELESALTVNSCDLDVWMVDARAGTLASFLRMSDLQRVVTVEDGRTLIARWSHMGAVIDGETRNLRRGLTSGRIAARSEVDRMIRLLDSLLNVPDHDWPLYKAALVPHGDWPARDRQEYVLGIDAAIANQIRPATKRQRDVLLAELRPQARDEGHSGMSQLPGGAVCYAGLIRTYTSFDLSAADIHRIGLEELARIQSELVDLGRGALGTSSLSEIRHRLLEDPVLFFKTPQEIEAAAHSAVERAAAAESRFLVRAPRMPLTIKAIDRFEERDAPLGYYRPGSIDGSRPGTFYLNTSDPQTRGRYELEALSFHEAIPGHHVQLALAQEITAVPEFRRHLGVAAFTEGWGLYAERLADDLGLYSGPLQRLGHLSFEAWRASRLVVDTGIHALGWSRAQAVAFLHDNTMLADNNIANEVDRYIAWPAQALAYTLGEREIRQLRAEAIQRLGARFDLASFHGAVLEGGAVSLRVLREQVEQWIRKRQGVEAAKTPSALQSEHGHN